MKYTLSKVILLFTPPLTCNLFILCLHSQIYLSKIIYTRYKIMNYKVRKCILLSTPPLTCNLFYFMFTLSNIFIKDHIYNI